MKTIIKLLLAAVLINAAARAGLAVYSYSQLHDATQQIVLFGGGTPVPQLQNAVVEKASELQLPVTPEHVEVTRLGPRTVIEVSYVQPIELFPRYEYRKRFRFSVDAFNMGGR